MPVIGAGTAFAPALSMTAVNTTAVAPAAGAVNRYDVSAGSITLTAPSVAAAGTSYVILKTDAGANTVTIGTDVLATPGAQVTYRSDGTSWVKVDATSGSPASATTYADTAISARGFKRRDQNASVLTISPVAVAGGFIFKPKSGAVVYEPVNVAKSATAVSDLIVSVAGTQFTVVYPSVTAIDGGWTGTVTLASTPAVTVTTTVKRLDRSTWRKTVQLTAASSTTARIFQGHTPTGVGTQLNLTFERAATPATTQTGLPIVGLSASQIASSLGQGFFMAPAEGYRNYWGVYPDTTGALDNSAGTVGNCVALNFGLATGGADAITLTAGVPVAVSFAYFTAPLDKISGVFSIDSARRRAHLAYALLHDDPVDDEFTYVMTALARGRTGRTIAASSNAWMFPAATYAGFCYVRDTWWGQLALMDGELSKALLTNFAGSMVGNIVPFALNTNSSTGTVGGTAAYTDDNAMHLLMWALWHRTQFGETVLTTTQRDNLATGIVNQITSGYWRGVGGGAGVVGPFGWLDSLMFNLPTNNTSAHMTGMAYVALKAANLLGSGVANAVLPAVKTAYQSFHVGGWLRVMFDRDTLTDPQGWVDVSALAPEFWANYLLGETLLTDAQVASHMDKLFTSNVVVMPQGRAFKVIANSDGSYLSPTFWKAYNPGGATSQPSGGEYQNGGSWLFHDFIALAAAKLHNYTNNDLDQMWADRIRAEFCVETTSHEWLTTSTGMNSAQGSATSTSWGFLWNCGVIGLEPFSGLRRR